MIRTADIGLRQGRRLCQMGKEERLAFLAEGMPILLASAQGFQDAATALQDRPREADVLRGFAEEEAAKILILLDAVRCPSAIAGQRLGKLMRWFYDHLARLIYASSLDWRPMHIAQLQRYVRTECEAHSLEGFAGEYILPSGPVHERESAMYADIETYDDGRLSWHEPRSRLMFLEPEEPNALRLTTAMHRLGLFSIDGLRAISDIWSKTHFRNEEGPENAKMLTKQTLIRLHEEGGIPETAEEVHKQTLYDCWQLPMYELEIALNVRPLDELRATQERMLWNEIGDW